MDKKPQVFPTQGNFQANANPEALNQNNDAFTNSHTVPVGEQAAAEEMRRRTAEQMQIRNEAIARTKGMADDGAKARAELISEMANKQIPQEQLTPQGQQEMINTAMSQQDLARFEEYANRVDQKKTHVSVEVPRNSVNHPNYDQYQREEAQRIADSFRMQTQGNTNPVPTYEDIAKGKVTTNQSGYVNTGNFVPPTPPSNYGQPIGMQSPKDPNDVYIEQLSQPQYNTAYDVIPLPSEGRLYKNYGKKNIKVAYLSTADENILTSPNLLNSGRFLEILINRKILEPELRYHDLIEGDRDAIMLWLRATGYGNMYPITVQDENGDAFETEVDLNELKTITLTHKPDENGHFDFKLPVSNVSVKFKLLSIGEVDEINEMVEYEMETLKMPINNTRTYYLTKQIVSINGDTNPNNIKQFAETMRVGDAKALRDYIDSINFGVDMNIEVRTPGGGSVTRFLPINIGFFWPDYRL
jgi:hypothetical protein